MESVGGERIQEEEEVVGAVEEMGLHIDTWATPEERVTDKIKEIIRIH